MDAARRHRWKGGEGVVAASGLFRFVAGGGGAAGDHHGPRNSARLQRGQQRTVRAGRSAAARLYGWAGAVRRAESDQAHRAIRRAVHPADRIIREDGPVQGRYDFSGRADSIKWSLASLPWHSGFGWRCGGVGSGKTAVTGEEAGGRREAGRAFSIRVALLATFV